MKSPKSLKILIPRIGGWGLVWATCGGELRCTLVSMEDCAQERQQGLELSGGNVTGLWGTANVTYFSPAPLEAPSPFAQSIFAPPQQLARK
eukprot:4429196-Amphidinium_carterae.1